nr:MAG TPA: hypothetical protein [Caudoviricetes sp.]
MPIDKQTYVRYNQTNERKICFRRQAFTQHNTLHFKKMEL